MPIHGYFTLKTVAKSCTTSRFLKNYYHVLNTRGGDRIVLLTSENLNQLYQIPGYVARCYSIRQYAVHGHKRRIRSWV